MNLRLAATAFGCAAGLVAPASTPAAVTIGQAGGGASCDPGFPYVQLQSAISYSPSANGVITSWSSQGDVVANRRAALYVVRPTPSAPGSFSAVAEDGPRTLALANQVNTFTRRRIPIAAGDRIALYAQTSANCAAVSTSAADILGSPASSGAPPLGQSIFYGDTETNFLVNLSAVVEPDSDADGFGDETQDRCVGTPNATAAGGGGCTSIFKIGEPRFNGKRIRIPVQVAGAGGVGARPIDRRGRQMSKDALFRPRGVSTDERTTHRVALRFVLRPRALAELGSRGKVRIWALVTYRAYAAPGVERRLSFVVSR